MTEEETKAELFTLKAELSQRGTQLDRLHAMLARVYGALQHAAEPIDEDFINDIRKALNDR
jgi:hypothetical protein